MQNPTGRSLSQLRGDQTSESGGAEAKVKCLLKSPSSRIQEGEPCCPLSCGQLVGYQTIIRDHAAMPELVGDQKSHVARSLG